MVVADPAAELLGLVFATARSVHVDDAGGAAHERPAAPAAASARRAALVRRRFGVSLPPPFAPLPPGAAEPVRRAVPADGAAIAAVKWRAFRAAYRGRLPDAVLDRAEAVPPAGFWVRRAMVPPSAGHRLWVWGRPGTAYGYADTGPVHAEDADPAHPDAGEVYELYVDPSAQGLGGGTRLLSAALEGFEQSGLRRAELWTLASNEQAQRFYEGRGWERTGRTGHFSVGDEVVEEHRYARPLAGDHP